MSRPRPTRTLLAAVLPFAGLLCPIPALNAQLTRPTACTVLPALLRRSADGPSSELAPDTARLQVALDHCPAGQAVELSRSKDQEQDTFLSGPMTLPPGVTLWLDPGVTLFASRMAADFDAPQGNRRALLTVLPQPPGSQPAALEGYGTLDARGDALLLDPAGLLPHTWWSTPVASRPDLLRVEGDLHLSGVTLRGASGIAIRVVGNAQAQLEHVAVAGNPALPELRSIVAEGGTVRISDSSLVGSVQTSDSNSISIEDTGLYAGSLFGQPDAGPCIANTAPAPACLPAALPPMLGSLAQTEPAQVAAILTVPDTRLPSATGDIELMEGTHIIQSAPVSASAAIFSVKTLKPGLHQLHARLASAGLEFGELAVTIPEPKPANASDTLSLTSSATTLPYGTSVTLTAKLATATGVVSFLDGTSSLGQVTMSGGSASLTISTLTLGPHTLTALYAGDTLNPVQQSPALTVQVNPVTTRVSLDPLPSTIVYGTTLTLAASVLPTNATGSIRFDDTGQPVGRASLTNGRTSLTLAGLLPGTHTFTAAYSGDPYDLAATSPAVQVTVTPADTLLSLAASPTSAIVGDTVSVQIAVTPSDASGLVTLNDGISVVARATLASGLASASVSTLAPGLHLLVANYPGDRLYSASSSSTVAVQVDRRPTATSLALLPATIPYATPITLSASVQPASATGMVQWIDRNAGILGQSSVAAGTASLNLSSLGSGTHVVYASYSGDTNNAPSASAAQPVTVLLGSTVLTLSGIPPSLPYSAPTTLLATLVPSSAAGSVSIIDSTNGPLGTMLLTSGTGSMALPWLTPGRHTVQATYGGDPNFAAAQSSLDLTITRDPSTTTIAPAQAVVPAGSTVLLNVRVANPYPNSPAGAVTVRVTPGSHTFSVPLTHLLPGESFATVALDSTLLGLGDFSAQAVYAGDTNDLASQSDSASFSVVPTPTTLVLTLPALAIPSGTVSTVTATVSSLNATPTGSISFFRNGTQLSVQAALNGVASVPLPGLSPGTYILSANFQPSGLFGPSIASQQILTVTPAVTILLKPSSFTIRPGANATAALSILPLSGYTGTYSAVCSSSTVYVACSIDQPAGAVPAAANVHLHVAPNTYEQAAVSLTKGTCILALMFPGFLLVRRRRLKWFPLTLAVCLLQGCGQGTFFDVPPGTYLVTVSVTAGGDTVSAPIQVTISQQ